MLCDQISKFICALFSNLITALMPTSVVSEIQEPSSTRLSSHTPPLPIVDPTCAALAKLAADVKFFNNCTSVTTKPCDAVFCSGGEHQYQASMILLLCNVPKAILLMLGNEKKVILQATVNHTEEIPVPELDLVLNITLDQFPLAIGLKVAKCLIHICMAYTEC